MRARYMTRLLVSAMLLLGVASPGGDSAAATLDWVFYDFFNVQPGEYFDNRSARYGESPINADCFTQKGIDNDVCRRPPGGNYSGTLCSTLGDCTVATYPWTVSSYTQEDKNRRSVTTLFRFTATGGGILGYNLTDPVFVPTFNSGESVGAYLDFTWAAEFVDTESVEGVETSPGSGVYVGGLDNIPCSHPGIGEGYYMWSTIELTMDLQQSRRAFGVVAADAADAQAWWTNTMNIKPVCGMNAGTRGAVEQEYWDWLDDMGGQEGSTTVGKYDIMNAYGWELDTVVVDISTFVDVVPAGEHELHAVGTTHVTIQHIAWGTSNLLDHMFYWGNTSYKDEHLDSTQAMGWQGMEPYAWYDEMNWSGTLNAGDIDFVFSGVMAYDFDQISEPGPDGIYNNHVDDPDDDFSLWAFRPHLADNLNNLYQHPQSELDRYPGATDIETVPGSPTYGQSKPRAFVPTSWDLFDGETVTMQFPTGNVPFYDPNLTPLGRPEGGNVFVVNSAPLELYRTQPANYGNWDPVAKTWTITGPTTTGGSVGSPGDYPDESWGAIYFVAAVPEPGSTIALVAGSGMLAMMNRRRLRRSGTI